MTGSGQVEGVVLVAGDGPVEVLVGSRNPVKIDAVAAAFARFVDRARLRVRGEAVSSGVPDQPFGEETFAGARERARALAGGAAADFYVGIEGGVMRLAERWFAFGCACVLDRRGREGLGTSPWFELPPAVVERLRAGEELGEVIDALTGQSGSKLRGGAIEFFTRGAMDRRALYEPGVVVALAPLLRPGVYAREQPA